jgi:undecaprenyl-diphosphatase
VIEIFILSIIQGITEFLPISSSSHLIIVSKLFDFQNHNLVTDVCLHVGSLIAVIIYFFNDFINFIKNRDLFIKILFSSLPVMLVGFFLVKINYIENLRNIEIIGWTTILFGILLYVSDKCKFNKNIKSDLKYKSAIFIGLFQVISLIPGVSRSGITITAARFLNFKRTDAAKISFLLSIPTLSAVSIFGVKNIYLSGDFQISLLNIFSIFFSFIFSFLTIKFFIKFLKESDLRLFVLYRLLLGTFLLIIFYS